MQIGISTGDRHGVSRADSTPGHAPRAGQGGDGTPDAPTTSPKDPSFEEALGSADKQPHSGKHAADTPATHADEATDTTKASHGSEDANGSGKVDANAQHGHDSAEHADADPNYDSLPDSSINQSEGFPEGVDPYTTRPRTRRQLQVALEAWPEYMKKELPQDAKEWHTGRFGFDDMVNPKRALGFNLDGSPRSMKDFMDTFFDIEGPTRVALRCRW